MPRRRRVNASMSVISAGALDVSTTAIASFQTHEGPVYALHAINPPKSNYANKRSEVATYTAAGSQQPVTRRSWCSPDGVLKPGQVHQVLFSQSLLHSMHICC